MTDTLSQAEDTFERWAGRQYRPLFVSIRWWIKRFFESHQSVTKRRHERWRIDYHKRVNRSHYSQKSAISRLKLSYFWYANPSKCRSNMIDGQYNDQTENKEHANPHHQNFKDIAMLLFRSKCSFNAMSKQKFK